MMFLKEDKIGSCSEIVYGRAGDAVKVMGAALGEMLLVKGRNDLFYVYPNELSENPIHENKEVNSLAKATEESRGRGKQKSKRTR